VEVITRTVNSHVIWIGVIYIMSMLDTLVMYEFSKLSNVVCGVRFCISVLSSPK